MMFMKSVAAGRRRYPVITNGLKLYLDAYNLDSYSGSGSTWTDLSNSGYNVTIIGPTWTESGGRRYFEFDGVNDYMVGNSTTTIFDVNTSGWTWSFWVNYVTTPNVLDVLICTLYDTVNLPSRLQYFDNRSNDGGTGNGNGYSTGMVRSSPGFVAVTSVASTVPTGSWINLNATFTYTGARTGTFKIYKDGVQLVTKNFSVSNNWTTINTFLPPSFGAMSINNVYQRFNNFKVGEILNYNRPLTAAEINKNYNATKSNYGKSVNTNGLKLHLDAYNTESYSGSGSTWNDLSNSGYNVNIIGPTWTESGGRRYFEFDGVNDYMEGNSDTSIFDINTSGNTWSFWIYWVTSPTLLDGIAVTYLDTSSGGANLIYSAFDHRNTDAGTGTGAGYCYSVFKSAIDKRTTYAETVPTGVWTQITTTFTYNTSTTATFKIYKNGSEVATENHTISGTTWDTLDFLRPFFGAVNYDGTMIRFNNIRLGEILQYNRPLTATEISNNYNSTKTNYGL